jgi:hypothetical protein
MHRLAELGLDFVDCGNFSHELLIGYGAITGERDQYVTKNPVDTPPVGIGREPHQTFTLCCPIEQLQSPRHRQPPVKKVIGSGALNHVNAEEVRMSRCDTTRQQFGTIQQVTTD